LPGKIGLVSLFGLSNIFEECHYDLKNTTIGRFFGPDIPISE
jgi:hypothetical protein